MDRVARKIGRSALAILQLLRSIPNNQDDLLLMIIDDTESNHCGPKTCQGTYRSLC